MKTLKLAALAAAFLFATNFAWAGFNGSLYTNDSEAAEVVTIEAHFHYYLEWYGDYGWGDYDYGFSENVSVTVYPNETVNLASTASNEIIGPNPYRYWNEYGTEYAEYIEYQGFTPVSVAPL